MMSRCMMCKCKARRDTVAAANLPMEQTARRAAPCPPQLIGVPLGTAGQICLRSRDPLVQFEDVCHSVFKAPERCDSAWDVDTTWEKA